MAKTIATEIVLTQGQVALVDEEDFERIAAHKWNAAWCSKTQSFYAQRQSRIGKYRQKTLIMHREIVGARFGEVVDHVNRNTLDNRRSNLRLCTTQENALNRGVQRNNTSGFKGVKRHTQCDRWVASVQLHRKRVYLGLFNSPIEAALAYDVAAVSLHGEFAVTNASLGLL